jgi:hypothetical protein
MLRENVKDAGEILQAILTQPLSIPGTLKEVSILEAAKNFDPGHAMTSDLRKILLNFLQFPDQTNTLIRELEILQNDLKTS